MQSWTVVSAGVVLLSACVTDGPNTEEGTATIDAPAVKPAQINPDECLNYIQLKRDSDYLCELTDGSTRPLKPSERRTSPLSREEITAVFSKNREDTENCIISVLGPDSKAEGKIYVKFEIGLDGKVTSSKYFADRSTFKNEKLGKCFAEKIRTWRFPILPGEDTLEITYPFALMQAESSQESSAPEKKD
jgi:hypothetical protein